MKRNRRFCLFVVLGVLLTMVGCVGVMEETPQSVLSIGPALLPEGRVGESYALQLVAEGGQEPYTWTSASNLPSGLSLAPDGMLSGVPNQAGAAVFTVAVTDAVGHRGSRHLTLTLQSVLCDEPECPHRIAVRQRHGEGEFFDTTTGETFVVRGVTLLRLAEQPSQQDPNQLVITHSTFNVGLYDAADMEAQLTAIKQFGYNTVRVFTTVHQFSDASGAGINQAYVANITDFLWRAKAYGLYVYMVLPRFIPRNWQRPIANPAIETFNALVLAPPLVEARKQFYQDFLRELKAQGAPLDHVLGFDVFTEIRLHNDLKPFTLNTGLVTTTTDTYDMASKVEKQAMMDDGIIFLFNEMRRAIRAIDPTALVAASFWHAGVPAEANPQPTILTTSFPVLAASEVDMIDLHTHNPYVSTFADFMEAFDVRIPSPKPLFVGEMGVLKRAFPTEAMAKGVLWDRAVGACAFGTDGWIIWHWDESIDATGEARWWSATDVLSDGGTLNDVFAPLYVPDFCRD